MWLQWQPTPVLLPGKSHGQKSLVGYTTVHGVAKSWTRLSSFTFTFHFHALEKEMATHSSVLAWRIPGTGEPGGLLSMGSHRIGHDWSDLATAAAVSYAYWVSLALLIRTREVFSRMKKVNIFHLLGFLVLKQLKDIAVCIPWGGTRILPQGCTIVFGCCFHVSATPSSPD